LRAPQRIGRDFQLAKAVLFNAKVVVCHSYLRECRSGYMERAGRDMASDPALKRAMIL
jgi:hypothetical protein